MAMRSVKTLWIMCIVMAASIAASDQPSSIVQRGLTFAAMPDPENTAIGITLMKCGQGADENNICNPYVGDTLCHTERALLCIIDIKAPAPAYLSTPEYWTGGLIARTNPVRGDRFPTVKDANSYCSQIFGKNWRVASFHDGGGWAMRAYGSIGNETQRVWIDIKDHPEGTCWSR